MKVSLGTVGVCHEGFAQVCERAGFAFAVGVGAVAEGAGKGSISFGDLYIHYTAKLRCQQAVNCKTVVVQALAVQFPGQGAVLCPAYFLRQI